MLDRREMFETVVYSGLSLPVADRQEAEQWIALMDRVEYRRRGREVLLFKSW